MKRGVVIVFVKAPVAGRVKTRLGAEIGMGRATALFRIMTARTIGEAMKGGWRVVLALALMRLVGGGVGLYGRGVFLLPMEEDLGVGRDSISLVYALTGLQVGLFAPVAGMLAQRYGGRARAAPAPTSPTHAV